MHIFRLQEVLYNIFVHRKSVRKEILEYESILRTTEWKIFSKKQCLNKVNWVYDYNCLECQSKVSIKIQFALIFLFLFFSDIRSRCFYLRLFIVKTETEYSFTNEFIAQVS